MATNIQTKNILAFSNKVMTEPVQVFKWNHESSMVLLDICAERKEKYGECHGWYQWSQIGCEFHNRAGRTIRPDMLKNRLLQLRAEYRIWRSLIHASGVQREPSTSRVSIPEAWFDSSVMVSRY